MIRFFGAFMIFSACALFGFYKSYELKLRVKLLKNIYSGLDLLEIRISHGTEEIGRLLNVCFKDCANNIVCKGNTASVDKSGLKDEDVLPLKQLFSSLGQSDAKSECAKINLCKVQTAKNVETAQNAYSEGAKLRQSLGICAGIALGIMVI